MHITAIVLSVLLALAFLGSGAQKLFGVEQSLQTRDQLRVDTRLWQVVGGLEATGGLGLLVGLALPLLHVVAAAALGMLIVGGIATHARAHDLKHAGPALLLLILSVALVVIDVT